ncbi:MAG TPA: DUF2207 domain-containing protein [Sphingomicrobium sp.]|jgi:uncharacterized membrane protein YgcG|nr:DUF2207 domain-containing protein [Sphingomicrobium sp.]
MRALWGAVAALLLTIPAAVRADERILRYLSDIQIQKDSSIDVSETIDVRAEHDRINHGIYRDIPTRYRGPYGTQFQVRLTLEGATLDGNPVKASVQPSGVGVEIKLGDPSTFVAVGEHEYVIRYRATREIGRFSQFDELYWNATGTQWVFPIDEATARIRLPEPVEFGQRHVYTGRSGSTSTDAQVIDEGPGEIAFQTTRPLGPYEGLTVAAAFPKGVVAKPTSGSRLLDAAADYGPPLLGLLSLLGLCGFYFVAWVKAGRNPRKGTIVPIFSPPDDLSPPGMRYVTRMSSDNRTFAAALVDMGVRGHIKLVEVDRGWLSGKQMHLERLAGKEPLPEEEEAALDCLCRPGEQIVMEQKNHENFSSAQSALQGVLKVRYEGKLFKRNIGWAAAGLFAFIACFWVVCAAIDLSTGGALVWQVGVVLGILVACALLWLAFHDSATGKCLLSVLGFVAVGTAVALGMPIFADALNSGWWLPLALPLVAAPIVLSAFWWIGAPTPEGRKVLDHIAGFKQYLSITEAERLDRMTPPKETPELFEKYLPFAIALAVENHWAKRFEGVLAAASAQRQQTFVWYSGSSTPWSNPTGFVGDVGSSLSSAVGAASTAPGSGGGGSSGGGGGGGGGGGW